MRAVVRRILFIGPHRPDRNPSQRFRMEQFFPYLNQAGIAYDYSWYLSAADDTVWYQPGQWLQKARIVAKAFLTRLKDVWRKNHYDVVFVQREAFMLGTAWFERHLKSRRTRLIYDFDDALWLGDTSNANARFAWLKRPTKINRILKTADLVIAGNDYLAAYAQKFNSQVIVIPSVVDTERFRPKQPDSEKQRLCIGWSGSHTTYRHFQLVLPALTTIHEKFKDQIQITVLGNMPPGERALPIRWEKWTPETEHEQLSNFDIGLMPLPEEEWSKGKCGFKALLYMAVGAVPVVSPVGVNSKIVQHGNTGFHATTNEEWISVLSQLITDAGLRQKVGGQARRFVEQHFSLQALAERWVNVLLSV
ncbi:MAG: glycosyltransferase family 4 protein [Chitinophagales bacterium]|nr:glycosyltransferase family 4 protein [Chitinophagales bacterium]MDW8428847.1 glycosyltransferase family 4 protein [Chitinophagales bacterium]